MIARLGNVRTSTLLLLPLLLAGLSCTTTRDQGGARTISFDTDEGSVMSVDISPDGRELVFDILGDIYTLPITGGKATLLVGGPSWDIRPRYTPDGKRVLLLSDRENDGEIWAVDRSGKQPVRILASDSVKTIAMNWSADGSELITRIDPITYRQLPRSFPSIDVNGIRIQRWTLTASVDPEKRYTYLTEGRGIRRIDNRTSEQTTLTDTTRKVRSAQAMVSRTGRWLAYLQTTELGHISLHLRDLKTGDERPLIDTIPGRDPEGGDTPTFTFTPDDQAILLGMGGKLTRVQLSDGARTIIPFQVSVQQQLAPLIPPPRRRIEDGPLTVRGIRFPTVSADGRVMVFGAVGKIWIQELPSDTPRRLTQTDDAQEGAVISPDGSMVAYISHVDSLQHADGMPATRARIMLVRLTRDATGRVAAGAPTIITPALSNYGLLTWVPDGRLAFSRPDSIHASRGKRSYAIIDTAGRGAAVIGPQPEYWDRTPSDGTPPQVADGRFYYVQHESTWGAPARSDIMSMKLDGTDRYRHLSFRGQIEVAAISPDGKRAILGPWLGGGGFLVRIPGRSEPADSTSPADPRIRRLTTTPLTYAHWRNASTAIFGNGPDISSVDSAGRVTAQAPIRLSVPRARPHGTYAMRGVRILTLAGEPGKEQVIESGTVVVTDGRITAVGDASAVPVPAETLVIDGTGLTIIPGLIDVHHHGTWPSARFATLDVALISSLAYGVTSGFDPSTGTTPIDRQLEIAEWVETGGLLGPRRFYTGRTIPAGDYPITSAAVGRDVAQVMAKGGAVLLKEYVQDSREASRWLGEGAREAGVGITAETSTLHRTLALIADGYTALEHANFMTPAYRDVAMFIAQSGVNFTPTVNVERWHGNGHRALAMEMLRDTPEDTVKLFRFVWPSILQQYRDEPLPYSVMTFEQRRAMSMAQLAADVARAGGTVSVGAHNAPGLLTHFEIWALVRGGMTPMQALRAASLNGAKKFGADRDLGSIEVGKLADFLVLTANPLEDIRNSLRMRYIVQDGIVYDGETLATLWPTVRPLPRAAWQSKEAYSRIPSPAPLR